MAKGKIAKSLLDVALVAPEGYDKVVEMATDVPETGGEWADYLYEIQNPMWGTYKWYYDAIKSLAVVDSPNKSTYAATNLGLQSAKYGEDIMDKDSWTITPLEKATWY